jgi:hypothetical protein
LVFEPHCCTVNLVSRGLQVMKLRTPTHKCWFTSCTMGGVAKTPQRKACRTAPAARIWLLSHITPNGKSRALCNVQRATRTCTSASRTVPNVQRATTYGRSWQMRRHIGSWGDVVHEAMEDTQHAHGGHTQTIQNSNYRAIVR